MPDLLEGGRDWIGLCSVLRPHQHSIGYTGDGFYRSKDPTNSIKVLKENLQKKIIIMKVVGWTMHVDINDLMSRSVKFCNSRLS